MPTIARVGTPSLATTLNDPGPHQMKGRAPTDLAAGDTLYMTATNTLAQTNGTAAYTVTGAASYVGVTPVAVKAGEKVVAYSGIELSYGANMTPGTRVYVSATPGAVDDAPTPGGTASIGIVTTPTNIYFFFPNR